MSMPHVCQVQLLGLTPYQVAWDFQETLSKEVGQGLRPPTLLLLEHPHTYTFGRRGREANLLWSEAELKRRGVLTFWVDRGGDVTYHGPGQLVGYPLLRLCHDQVEDKPTLNSENKPLPIGPVDYVRLLEKMLIQALAVFGVQARTIAGKTGVWVADRQEPAKIGAIGVKVDGSGLTRHGFALNVDPAMEYWQGIVGCGLSGARTTSLAEILGEPPAMSLVINAVIHAFGDVLDFEMTTITDKTG